MTGTSLLTIGEVADRLAVSVRTVRNLANAGELRKLKIRSSTRFEPGDVDAYIARLRGARQGPAAIPITDGQLRAFHAKAHALDRELDEPRNTSKVAALEYATALLGRTITSPSDLSAPEATKILDYLDVELSQVTA